MPHSGTSTGSVTETNPETGMQIRILVIIAILTFTVDPDELITGDANRSNNQATIDVFIGRAPNASITIDTGNYTFENVFIDARASFDPDSGDDDSKLVDMYKSQERPLDIDSYSLIPPRY